MDSKKSFDLFAMISCTVWFKQNLFRSLSHNIALPHSVAEVEALVVARALKFALELGIYYVVFEGDLELVINSLKDCWCKHNNNGNNTMKN